MRAATGGRILNLSAALRQRHRSSSPLTLTCNSLPFLLVPLGIRLFTGSAALERGQLDERTELEFLLLPTMYPHS